MTKTKTSQWQEKIEEKIFKFIAYKSRTEKEITDKLNYYLSKTSDLDSADKNKIRDKVISKIESLNLVDDRDYARRYVAEKIAAKKPVSSRQIKKFLLRKGVKEKIIEEALVKYSGEFEEKRAFKDAKKKLISYKNKDKRTTRRLLIQYLSRKGYPYEIVYTVVDNLGGVK